MNRRQTLLLALLALLALFLFPSASWAGALSQVTPSASLKTVAAAPTKNQKKRDLRGAAMRSAAMAYGAQSGFAWETTVRNHWLLQHAALLDKVFTFRPFIDGNHVLVPSIVVGRRDFSLGGRQLADRTDISYRIQRRARIVSLPPTYRSYLVLPTPPPHPINPILYPRTSREKENYKRWVLIGWSQGTALSDRMFQINTRRLVRALEGRIRFDELNVSGEIEREIWSRSPAMTHRTSRTLDVGTTVLRITRDARFTSRARWQPLRIREEK